MLIAFLIYNDGIGTIIRMATSYGTEIGIDQTIMIAAIMIVQFVGIPCRVSLRHAGRSDRCQAIDRGRAGRLHGDLRPWLLHEERDPFRGAGGPGRGGAGRNASLEPVALRQPDSTGQVGRVLRLLRRCREIRRDSRAGCLSLAVGSSRGAILAIIAFFAVGRALLYFVDVDEGQQAGAEEAIAGPG